VSFFGIRCLTWFEWLYWLPSLVVFAVATGVSREHFVNPPTESSTASGVLGFLALQAGFTLTYSPFSSDYMAYTDPEAQR
jgi:purine-cytosine permease-like protein